MSSNYIYTKLVNLTTKEIERFSFFCMDRIINLYKKIDINEDLSEIDKSITKGQAFNKLKYIYDVIKNDGRENLKALIEDCDPLILDVENYFDNTTVNEVCCLVAQNLNYILNYLNDGDIKFANYLSSSMIEIINQVHSDRFYKNSNSEASDDEIETYLKPIFENEYLLQLQAIDLIEKGRVNDLKSLLNSSKINW